jgi:hypothetical protein
MLFSFKLGVARIRREAEKVESFAVWVVRRYCG